MGLIGRALVDYDKGEAGRFTTALGGPVPLFFIEMGQGIIGQGDLRVSTSALYSCTLIAGRAASGYGGAFHYPARALRDPAEENDGDSDVCADMDVWATVLRPSAVTLVHALDSAGGLFLAPNARMGTGAGDRLQLRQWVLQHCGVEPTVTTAVRAGMELLANGMAAGSVGNLAGDFEDDRIDVSHWRSGRYLDYGSFTLVGISR